MYYVGIVIKSSTFNNNYIKIHFLKPNIYLVDLHSTLFGIVNCIVTRK